MIYHIIRNNLTYCLFQEIVQMSLHNNLGDKFYISSGFFQEKNYKNNSFYASSTTDTHNRSFVNNPNRFNQTIETKGVYGQSWVGQYDAFVNALSTAGYTVIKHTSNRHHAKVFLCFDNNYPVLEIIGSTNITSTAYGINHPNNLFNTEADLVIVNDPLVDAALNQLINDINETINHKNKTINDENIRDYIMVLNYDESNNKNIVDQMIWIKDNLF